MKLRTVGNSLYVAPEGFRPKTISASALKTYLGCPRDYWGKYVLGLWPQEFNKNFCMGNLVHLLLANHFKGLSDQAAIDEWKRSERVEQHLDKKEIDDMVTMALGMVDNNKSHTTMFGKPTVIEEKRTTVLENPLDPRDKLPIPFVWKPDLIVPEGIVDHKTASAKYKDDADTVQLDLYTLAYWATYKKLPPAIIFNILLKRKGKFQTQVIEFEPNLERSAVVFNEAKWTVQRILLGDFKAQWSRWCDTCPRLPEKRSVVYA